MGQQGRVSFQSAAIAQLERSENGVGADVAGEVAVADWSHG